jgi:predicted dinucleotide-utilizing enzyme
MRNRRKQKEPGRVLGFWENFKYLTPINQHRMKIAILGFGKLGKTLFEKMQQDPAWQDQFEVGYLWNRSPQAFEGEEIPDTVKVCGSIEEILTDIEAIDLVIECAHPKIIQEYGEKILMHTDLFVSSPTAFSDAGFHAKVVETLGKYNHRCFLPLGASIGVWDIIRLDQNGQLKTLLVEMRKHPDSFRIDAPEAVARLETARGQDEPVEVLCASVGEINPIAPQNTNTMSIYALAAQSLGFKGCKGSVVADRRLEAHIVTCKVETTLGLTLDLVRDNPAQKTAVTGSATFGSFLNSVLYHAQGISYNNFVFC